MKRGIRKRILSTGISTLLFFSTVLAVFPQTAVNVYAENLIPLWVGDKQVDLDDPKGDNWTYRGSSEKGTLTLDGATINGNNGYGAIEAQDGLDLTIEVKGQNNEVTGGNSAPGAIKVTGKGKLTIKGIDEARLTLNGRIYTDGDLIIEDVEVTVDGKGKPAISAGLEPDSLTTLSDAPPKVNVTIDSSNVTATGSPNGILASGTVSLKYSSDGKYATRVSAHGRSLDESAGGDYPAILANEITIPSYLRIKEPAGGEVKVYSNTDHLTLKTVKSGDQVANDVLIVMANAAKVTFKVKDGAWNDGSKEDKTVILSGNDGEALKLSSDQIPEVGDKPNSGYKAGNWDTVPNTSTRITGDTTYTYSYTDDPSPTPTVTPTPTPTPIPSTTPSPRPRPRHTHDDDDDDEDEDEPTPPDDNKRSSDGYDELRQLLDSAASTASITGKEQTVRWNQGTSLPYDVMKKLQDNPKVTLVFSYTYQGVSYVLTIPGKLVVADPDIYWYGPLYLNAMFGNTNKTRTYRVQPGDTLSGIAKKLNTSVDNLQTLNKIKDPDKINVGLELKY